MFSAGGSGTFRRLAVLRYDEAEGKIVNLLPWVGVTNLSQFAIWNLSQVSPYPILVIADFVWGAGESHFDSPYFYAVGAWKFDPGRDRYVKAFEYETLQKHDGGNSAPIRVLQSERPQIVQRLKSK